MDEKRKRIIKQIIATISVILPFDRIYLFGSASTDSWDGKGDWDLLIITPKELSRREKWTIAKTIRIDLAKSNIASDILILSQEETNRAIMSPHSVTRMAIDEGIKIA